MISSRRTRQFHQGKGPTRSRITSNTHHNFCILTMLCHRSLKWALIARGSDMARVAESSMLIGQSHYGLISEPEVALLWRLTYRPILFNATAPTNRSRTRFEQPSKWGKKRPSHRMAIEPSAFTSVNFIQWQRTCLG